MINSEYFINLNEKGKKRVKSHIIGEKGVDILKELIPKEWVIREYIPDYGIDIDLELFEKNNDDVYITKGEHILIQVKGIQNCKKENIKIYNEKDKTKYNMDVIKYVIDTDLIMTVEKMGSSVPVLLIVVDICKKEGFFVCLNDYIEKIIIPHNENYYNQKTITINIPYENRLTTEFGKSIILWYGKRAKLYSLFNLVNCQLRNLDYECYEEYKKIFDSYLRRICRLDLWETNNFICCLQDIKEEIVYYLEHQNTKWGDAILRASIDRGEDIDSKIWEINSSNELVSYREVVTTREQRRLIEYLCNLGDMYEDDYRNFYLPTWYYCMISSLYITNEN